MAELTRREKALTALASMPNGQATPVQVIKILFLMEKRAPNALGGAKFEFVPYDYGPFDQSVYTELERLSREGYIEIVDGKPRRYALTDNGRVQASVVRAKIDQHFVTYFDSLGRWIAQLTFAQLVNAIYREYPEMRANSIFRG
jgi:uncharacterized protein